MRGGVVDVSGAESLWVEQRRVHCVPAGAVSDDQPGLAAAPHVVVEAVYDADPATLLGGLGDHGFGATTRARLTRRGRISHQKALWL